MTTHRGARVDVDVRRVTRVVVGICLVSLLVTFVALLVAGVDKNSQINDLRANGVPVKITVVKCLGLLGGSGSNGAGYACTGTYSLDGHRYVKSIPGDKYFEPGAIVHGVAASDDPSLVTTSAIAANEHASFDVFVVPIVLLVVMALLLLALAKSGRLIAPDYDRRADGGV